MNVDVVKLVVVGFEFDFLTGNLFTADVVFDGIFFTPAPTAEAAEAAEDDRRARLGGDLRRAESPTL